MTSKYNTKHKKKVLKVIREKTHSWLLITKSQWKYGLNILKENIFFIEIQLIFNILLIMNMCLLLLLHWQMGSLHLALRGKPNDCYRATQLSYTYIYTFHFIHSFPLQLIIRYWTQFSVPYSRTLLLIHSTYKSLHLLTPTSYSIPPPTLSSMATTSLLCPWLCLCVIDKSLCVIFWILHISDIMW